jgi:Winged helix-turn helix
MFAWPGQEIAIGSICRLPLANQFRHDSGCCMIGVGFLDAEGRSDLIGLARLVRGSLTHATAHSFVAERWDERGNRQSALSGRRTNRTWIAATLPRTTREVGAWIENECGIAYESRSSLIALLHRLDMEHRKPKAVSSKLDPGKQAAFIKVTRTC